MKYTINSQVRFEILFCLYKSPSTIKEITEKTGYNYSHVSRVIKELKNMGLILKTNDNKLRLTNNYKNKFVNICILNKFINTFLEYPESLNNHKINKNDLKYLKNPKILNSFKLVKSTPKNYDKVMEVVENLYMGADFVKSIFPFFTPNFQNILNYVVKNQVKVKIILPENLIKKLKDTCKKFNLKEDQLTNIKIEKLKNHPNFSLTVTSKGVCLGFFRKDGVYDSKSLLVSNDSDAISWALNVFEDFKANEDNSILITKENFGVDDL